MDEKQHQHLAELRLIHQKRLQVLESQAASFGLHTPPHVLTEIEDIKKKVASINVQLAETNHFQIISAPSIPEISEPKKIQKKILILTAIPHGLRLDKEIREIEEAIRRAANRELFEIRIRTAVRPKDIRRAIAEEKPQIVHFCGHGSADGSLILEDEAGQLKPVTPDGLTELFKLHANYVICVLLNVCHSEKLVEAISQYINYVIGMNQAVQDGTTIEFAQGFYDALGYDDIDAEEKFQRAFQEGILAIKLAGLPGYEIPFLKKKLK